MSVSCVVCCQVEVSASRCSLVQRSPTDCSVSKCDREASIMRKPWPTRGCCAMGGNIKHCKIMRRYELDTGPVVAERNVECNSTLDR